MQSNRVGLLRVLSVVCDTNGSMPRDISWGGDFGVRVITYALSSKCFLRERLGIEPDQ
jgi:hypothetical protein